MKTDPAILDRHLATLRLPFIREHCQPFAATAAKNSLSHLGYLPIDQRGADLLFQVISARYERGSIILTTNKAFKQWPTIFNGDSTITSAVLDRLLHHGHTVVLEGSSYRMKDRAESWKTPPLTPQKPMPGHPIFKLPESSDVHAAARSVPGKRSIEPLSHFCERSRISGFYAGAVSSA